MSDIAAFIRARMDEREAAARAVTAEEWDGESALLEFGDLGAAAYAHVRRHNPARALRAGEAMRAIVELHDGPHECSAYDHRGNIDNCTWIDDGRTCSTLRLIAAIDSDHPDYDKSWSPVTC